MLRSFSVTITATILWIVCSSFASAASKKPKQVDQFPPSPLEITVPDPLLPQPNQQLSPEESQNLQRALDELNQQATAKLQAGDKAAAFDTWNRELRLRRALGSVVEVQALSRVGAIAYNENERLQVQYITKRLEAIQQQAQSENTVDVQLLRSLGQAYQQVRSPKQAMEVYDRILATVRQQQDAAAEVETLRTMAEVHLSWFDYPKAAASYEELLNLAAGKSDRISEATYLQQLAYVYEQAKNPQESLRVRNRLAELYLNEKNLTQLPALRLAIASDYQALGQTEEAFRNYQEAYASAWGLQQYARAGDALRGLILLYRAQGQTEDALKASQILINTEELATNTYGLMNAYDQMGQIYLQNKDYPQALAAFQKGLELAQQLKHQEDYFQGQISQVSQQISNK